MILHNIIIIFAVLNGLPSASFLRYDNYTLFKVLPKILDDIKTLTQLETSGEYDFWTYPKTIGEAVDILVSPNEKDKILEIIQNKNMDYEVVSENIQEKIDEEAKINVIDLKKSTNTLGWSSYHTLNEIYSWMRKLEIKYPNIVSVIEGGKTYEGRKILGVKVSFRPGNENRSVWLDSLIHAREWITGATTTFILNELLTSSNPDVRQMAENHDWYIFPVINPDGYIFSRTHNRLWRKNRKPYGSYFGADLNRNWDFKWNQGGSSKNPESNIFAGNKPFSEIETNSLSRFIKSIGRNLIAYLSFHCFSQLILLPYAHTKQHLDNYDEVHEISIKAVKSLSKRYGTKYTVGNPAEILYVVTGNSIDWVKATLRVPVVLTFELRPDKGKTGFILPPNEIVPTGLETLDALITILKETNRLL